ncbi:hypothetical protein AB6D37_10920 [Pectobacterium brasiliense]|uniref:hypothetical protein n=1 Tax=Pectobacterium brasiliense TaxID=180957 RepID=UPI003988647E
MIDIRSELEAARKDFYPLAELISIAEKASGEDLTTVCQWLLKKINEALQSLTPLRVYKIDDYHELVELSSLEVEHFIFLSRKLNLVITKGNLPIEPDDIPFGHDEWLDLDFFEYGLIRAEISKSIPDLTPYLDRTHSPDGYYCDNISHEKTGATKSDLCEIVTPPMNDNMKWSDFAGKDTALMFIAGLAAALELSGGKYLRGGKMNKSAIAKTAIDAINTHGNGTMITEKALTNLLNDALKENITKNLLP